jgi:hypothetical protein
VTAGKDAEYAAVVDRLQERGEELASLRVKLEVS